MITVLAGPNSLMLAQDLNCRVIAFVTEHGDLALERIDGQEAELPRIREALISLPFLASKKMVVLRAPSANKEFLEQAENMLPLVSTTTDLIIIEPKLDKRSAYYKLLKKTTDLTEYSPLDANGLAAWLVRTAKQEGGSIQSNDARYLIDRVGLDQQMLFSDLQKLLLHDKAVTKTSIDLLTDRAPQSTIFQLLEAAFAGKAQRASDLYNEQRALKVEAPQIIAMLAWQLHILVLVKAGTNRSTDQIAKDAKISPYVVQKSASIARLLSLARLKQLITELLDIDVKSKRTSLDIDDALQLYLVKLAY